MLQAKEEALVQSQEEEKAYVWVSGLAPSVAVTLGLYGCQSAWGSIVFLHLSMLLPPAFLTHCFDSTQVSPT